MAIVSNLSGVKLALTFTKGSQTVSGCNENATPEEMHQLSTAIGELHEESLTGIKKVVEYTIEDEL